MPGPITPRGSRGHGLLFNPQPIDPLVDNGPPVTPSPGPTDWIYQWEAHTSNVTEHRFGGSCRGSQVMIPVGKCRITPPLIGWAEESTAIYFAWCFGAGPAASISNWQVSGQDEGDIPGLTMTTKCSANYRLGVDGQSGLTGATYIWGGGADVPTFDNLIVTLGAFYKSRIGTIGLPTITADVVMKSYDFRSGTEAYTTNENPVLALYTYLVLNPWGPRVPAAEIDSTSWTTAATWCDTDMDPGGNTQRRWRAGGVLDGGDVTAVVQSFLQAAWCTLAWLDGKWYLVPYAARNSTTPTVITADYIRRRRLGFSRRPTVVHVNFRDCENEYLDRQVIARSAGAVAGTSRWVVRTDSPALINAEDVAQRYANTLLNSVSNNNRATVKVHHDQFPAVLDLKPGDNVRLSTWHVAAGTGADDVWRVESINHQELVSELELLGDEDALATTLTTNTTGLTKTTITPGRTLVVTNTTPIMSEPAEISTNVTEDMDYTVGLHFHDAYGTNWSIGFETGDKVVVSDEAGDKCAYNTAQGDAARFYWDEAGTFNPSTSGTVKGYAQMKDSSIQGVFLQFMDSAAQDGYTLSWAGIAGGHGQTFKLQKWIGAAAQWSSGNTWGTTNNTTKYWVALEVDSVTGYVRGKSWTGAKADEPIAWGLEIADASIINDTCKLAFVFTDDGVGSRYHWAYDFALEVASAATYTETGEELAVRVNDTLTLGGSALGLQLNASPTLGVTCLQPLQVDGDLTMAADKNITLDSGILAFENGGNIYSDTGSVLAAALHFTTSDITIGSADGGPWRTILQSKDYVDLQQDTRLANNKALEAAESGGTARDLIVLDGSNDIIVGNATTDTKLYGNPITSVSLHKFGNVAGGNYVEMQTDGDIVQAGTSIMQTATRIVAPEHRGKLWQTTLEKALTDNGAVNLFQWDGSTGRSAAFLIFYEVTVTYTQVAATKILQESGVIVAMMADVAGTVTVAAAKSLNAQNNTGTGAMTVTAGTGNGTDYGRVSITADLTTGTWVSGEVRYAVINTDTDFSALTLFG
jgi:hypothetical protein